MHQITRNFKIKTALAVLCVALIISLSTSERQAQAGSYYAPDGTRPKDFSFLKVGNTWHTIGIHAYYSPAPGGPGSPGLIHSTSTDMISWTDIGAAIAVGAPGTWESYDVWAPTIIKNGSTYHMWYTGVKLANNQWVQKIGHATSTDLTTWTKDPANPVWDCSTLTWTFWDPNSLEAAGTDCRDPYVVRDEANNQWVMFYTARVKTLGVPPVQWLANPPIVGLATSPDLVTWSDAGYIFTTAGYAAESPHVIERNGTWWLVFTTSCSWRGTKCLRYATAPALTGPYTGYADLPAAGGDEYASEYFKDDSGQEYFGRVGWIGGWLDFDYLNWPNNTFTLNHTPSGEVRGKVWKDENGNGQINTSEPGVSDVWVVVYTDNGDEVFDPTTDIPFKNSTTLGASLSHPLRGTYKIPFFSSLEELPWALFWVRVDPDSLDYSNPALTGMSPTTPTVVRYDNRAGGVNLTNINFGYNGNDATAPATVSDLNPQ